MAKVLKRMVARDGVEPPTPAFSGLLSANGSYVAGSDENGGATRIRSLLRAGRRSNLSEAACTESL